ncbi:SDR family NAD(P)-dependent oxidoreductase [Natronosalvus vescus]|uniref:SDR family NAD(P)-dependent oxidoreductase n=1 Tax=Natronosalvus vescus TaxID=2953881 RepID=UPI002091B495|nr:SDR family oxidoreductase [Natronosalvus vescus]
MDESTVVVTGGTGGIGSAVAAAFLEAGATVVIGARDAAEIEETVDSLASDGDGDGDDDGHPQIEGLRTDVRDEFDLERLMETASRAGKTGGIDVVAACAGVYHGTPGETPSDSEPYSRFDDHLATNARGVFGTITEALPHLNEGARVLVPTGAVAREAKPGYGSYAMSKAAAEAVVRGFAADTDFVVGCLEPGQLATELTNGHGRDPETVAGMFVWAATECIPATLDGAVVDLKTWKQATR